jgi:protein-disulfide isomerase
MNFTDIAEGLELGIHSTPVHFFNGHFIKGVPTGGLTL